MVNTQELVASIVFEVQHRLNLKSDDKKEIEDGLKLVTQNVLQTLSDMGFSIVKTDLNWETLSDKQDELRQAIESCVHTDPEEGVEVTVDTASVVQQLQHYGFKVLLDNSK